MYQFQEESNKYVFALLILFLVFAAAPPGPRALSKRGETSKDKKVVYLTFDDGPGIKVTPRILDILREEGIPGTFFVLGSEVEKNPEMLRRIYREGHRIANHSYGHEYEYLYGDPKNLTDDIRKAEQCINEALRFDYGNRAFRFPGGSSQREQRFRDAVEDMGYKYYGWNSSGEDSVSSKGASAQEILANVMDSAGDQREITLLLHDSDPKSTTADALPEIIKYFCEKGYEFQSIPFA